MMKQQHSASNLSPSRLCRIFFLALTLKIFVLAGMVFEPFLPDIFSSDPSSEKRQITTGAGIAHAAEGALGAPPALDTNLPDVAMPPKASAGSPSSMAGATQGQTSPGMSGTDTGQPKAWTLPPVSSGPKAGGSSGNGTLSSNEGSLNRDLLTRKQEELNRKEQELKALQSDISDKLEKMQLLENRLNIMMKDAQTTNDEKFRHLVDVLSNMKTKSAAQVLESLDQRTAVKVLAGMRGRQAGEILTFVRPEVAASLTEGLTRMQLPLE